MYSFCYFIASMCNTCILLAEITHTYLNSTQNECIPELGTLGGRGKVTVQSV